MGANTSPKTFTMGGWCQINFQTIIPRLFGFSSNSSCQNIGEGGCTGFTYYYDYDKMEWNCFQNSLSFWRWMNFKIRITALGFWFLTKAWMLLFFRQSSLRCFLQCSSFRTTSGMAVKQELFRINTGSGTLLTSSNSFPTLAKTLAPFPISSSFILQKQWIWLLKCALNKNMCSELHPPLIMKKVGGAINSWWSHYTSILPADWIPNSNTLQAVLGS